MRKRLPMGAIFKKKLELDEVLPFIPTDKDFDKEFPNKFKGCAKKFKDNHVKNYGEYKVKMYSANLITFKSKGIVCPKCGMKGEFFIIQKKPEFKSDFCHLALYGRNKEGELVLFTKDHIIPKSKGGANHIDNYQTMCFFCNGEKSNYIQE